MWYQGHEFAPSSDRGNPLRWRTMNPGWQVLEWNHVNLTEFIRGHYPQYFPAWNSLGKVIKKCDLARLLVLHYFGGAYMDLDLVPLSPLDGLLNSKRIRHSKTAYVTVLPQPESVESVNLLEMDAVFSREYRPIDKRGFGVANGAIIAKPGCQWMLDFIDSRINNPGALVLDYMGPHALTRFLRERTDLHRRVRALPPYYLLWEPHYMQQPPPDWVVCLHPAVNSWGDHSKVDFWRT